MKKINKSFVLGFFASSGLKLSGLNYPTGFLALFFSDLKIIKIYKSFFLIPIIALIIFLLLHFYIGSISFALFFKNIFRLVLPFIVAALISSKYVNKPIELVNLSKGMLVFCFLDLSPILFDFNKLFIVLKTGNIYMVKDHNLFLQNTNYTAFFIFCSCFAALVAYDISGKRNFRLLFFNLFLASVCFSRAYLGAIFSMIMVAKIPESAKSRLFKRNISLAVFSIIITLQLFFIVYFRYDEEFIKYFRSDIDGSAATKLEILFYACEAINKYGTKLLIGLGPQVIDLKILKTYASHSLVGIFPELGAFIAVYLIPFFLLSFKAPRYFFYNLGFFLIAINISFPLAYVAPWLVIVYLCCIFSNKYNIKSQLQNIKFP